MQLTMLALLTSLSAVCFAAPANNHVDIVPRQTYIITCIGGRCTDNISRPTSGVPQPTTSKVTTTTTKKPEPEPTTSSKKPEPTPTTTSKKPEPPKSSTKPAPTSTTTTKKPEPPTTSKKPEPTPTKTTIKTTTKTTEKPTQTTGEETGPSSTRCPVPAYYKCGGWDYTKPWDGCTVCEKGSTCVEQNEWYFQCVPNDAIVAE